MLFDQLFNPFQKQLRLRFKGDCAGVDQLIVFADQSFSFCSADSLDAANSGCNAAFFGDAEESNSARCCGVSASTKLFRRIFVAKVDIDDADLRSIFLSKKLLDVCPFLCFVVGDFIPADRMVVSDFFIGKPGPGSISEALFEALVGAYLKSLPEGYLPDVNDGTAPMVE